MRLLINRRNQLDGAYLDDLRVGKEVAVTVPLAEPAASGTTTSYMLPGTSTIKDGAPPAVVVP